MKKAMFFLVMMCALTASGQTADEIIEKAEDKLRGTTLISEMKITTVRPKWTRVMEVKGWSDGKDFSVTLIKSPAKDKGNVFLKRYNEIWNYVPSIERTVKMPPSMMSQSWMGTDLKNDDLVQESSKEDDFDAKIVGSEIVSEFDCHKIELTPKEDANVIWGKIVIWISKEDYMQLKTRFYDEDLELVNSFYGREVKELDGRKLPTVMIVKPANKKGHKTVMRYTSLKFDEEIPAETFTEQYMKRLK